MEITPIRALEDNYIWIIEKDNELLIVDPGEAQPVIDYLESQDEPPEIVGILLTHNHEDHIGGVQELLDYAPSIQVFGPREVTNLVTQYVEDGDELTLLKEHIGVIHTPGHTTGHISFLIDNILFCGDALFSGGCGRVFTGDYQAQFDTLRRLRKLPHKTKVYAGHEYTQTNLEFAVSIEPDNTLIKDELAVIREYTRLNKETYPTTIGREEEINLFMQARTVDEFTGLRDLRDNF